MHQTKRDLEKQKQYINDLCQERGLSVPEKGRHFDGKEINDGDIRSWNKNTYNLLIDKEKPSFLADCALAVMDTLPLSANKEDFIKGMGSRGWSVRWENKRKHITFMDKKGHKIRDSNLAKTFSFNISKETLNREFERTTHDKAIHDRAISTAIARADSAVKNGRNEIRISRANRGTDGGTEDNSDPEGRKTKPCSG